MGGAMNDIVKPFSVDKISLLAGSDKLWAEFHANEEELLSKEFGGRTADIIVSAKRRHRTDLSSKSWSKYNHYLKWDDLKSQLKKDCVGNIERIHANQFSIQEFHEMYERPLKPVLIQGLADHWPARTDWNLPRLRSTYGERTFKCGEDDDGYPIRVKLKHFLRYQNSDEPGGAKLDDSPLYIFDSRYDDDKISKQMLDEYQVPHLFSEDLFRMVGEKRRPPYRWILFGPSRSGSNVHIDPLGTSAWNTLIRGHKLWTLFPPDVPKAVVKGKEHVRWKEEDDEPVDWYANVLPRILGKEGPLLRSRMIQFIQKPGETVFVPSNWWHGVLNLDTTIAVTQNFCSSGNFECVWRNTRSGRKKMARSWLKHLEEQRPDLAALAREIDRLDRFDLELEIQNEQKKRDEKKKKKR